jgi:hypothetical protein
MRENESDAAAADGEEDHITTRYSILETGDYLEIDSKHGRVDNHYYY